MSRHEELEEKVEKIDEIFGLFRETAPDSETVMTAIEGAKLEMLTEIARSLATIADSLRDINARQALKDI